MTSGTGLLEIELPHSTEFATPSEEFEPAADPQRAPARIHAAPGPGEADAAPSFGPQNGRKGLDDDEDEGGENEVEFDDDDEAAADDESDADDDDDFDDDDDDDFDDDDDDDDADDFDDE